MFSRKKPEPPKRRQHNLAQFGLTDIPTDFDPTAGYGDDNDSDLEAELDAIMGGGAKAKTKPKPQILPPSELDKIVAASLKDVDSDDDDDIDESDLMGELHEIAGNEMEQNMDEEVKSAQEKTPDQEVFLPTSALNTVDLIEKRIEMYEKAEAYAKSTGEAAKARRFGRGLKTLTDALHQAKNGKTVVMDDLPPELGVKNVPNLTDEEKAASTPSTDTPTTPATPLRPAPSPPKISSPSSEESPKQEPKPELIEDNEQTPTATASNVDSAVVEQMRNRQREYKAAALKSKRAGDTPTALQFLKVVKQFDLVVQMYESGQEVDLSDMPPPPEQFLEFMAKMQEGEEETSTAENNEVPAASVTEPTPAPAEVTPAPAVPVATTVLEALQQRLEKYKSVEEAAKLEGNASKARRFGRIVKQYEDAIKLHKAGRVVPYDELPVPPGYGPLPTEGATSNPTPAAPPKSASSPGSAAQASQSSPSTERARAPEAPQKHDLTTRTSGNQQKNNIAEQQMKLLLERQREFKLAALQAKKSGEIDQAKEYLKIYKGFEALLNAASSGLPVDLSTLPIPPTQRENLEASFAIVSTEECDADDDMSDIVVRVEEQLAKQLMMCKNTRDHHKAMGDIAGMNRFENLALAVQKDLDLVRYSKRKNFPLPKFHYEKRSFNIVHCNTDLTDNEMEIMVVRGINYNVPNPKDVDTYVKIECPLLNDEFFRNKTSLVKDTDNPEYNQRFNVDIQRGSRQFQRIFKRQGVKFEVYSRGGFLRSDNLIGTVTVKLQPLETKCDIHDTFNLMEGRRSVGGKLEVKIRVRNPMLTKQIENINEKWLVLDPEA